MDSYRFFSAILNYAVPFDKFKEKYDLLTDRKILLVDINKRYLEECRKWCGEDRIISEMPYTSTNDSEMVILLIKMK